MIIVKHLQFWNFLMASSLEAGLGAAGVASRGENIEWEGEGGEEILGIWERGETIWLTACCDSACGGCEGWVSCWNIEKRQHIMWEANTAYQRVSHSLLIRIKDYTEIKVNLSHRKSTDITQKKPVLWIWVSSDKLEKRTHHKVSLLDTEMSYGLEKQNWERQFYHTVVQRVRISHRREENSTTNLWCTENTTRSGFKHTLHKYTKGHAKPVLW